MKPTDNFYQFPENGMKTPETKLTVKTTDGAYQPDSLLSFNHHNREVLRITHDGRMICGEGLSANAATQEAAKLLIQAFEQEIQKMLDARSAAELVTMNVPRREKAEASAKLWEADALRYAKNAEYWQSRAEKAEAQLHALTLICGTSDANKFQSWVDREREKVRVLRDALKVLVENEGIGPESMFHNAREALVITWEASK
jgi:hypothetical protein